MDEFSLKLDLSEVMKAHQDLASEIRQRLEVAAKNLAAQAHAHLKEEAAKKLHSRLEEFNQNLEFKQIDQNTWVISLSESARWIDDGMEPHSMLEDLLASPKARRSKRGGKYIVVPFKHDKAPTRQTPHTQAITAELKKGLKALKIPYKKIEKNPDGSPKLGLLHKADLQPPKDSKFPMVGKDSGTPFLQGVRIYQRLDKNKKVQRDIFTFRTASSNVPNKWFHPGIAPAKLFEETFEWVKTLWDTQIAPEVISGLGGNL